MQGKKLIEENEMYSMVLWCKRWEISVRNQILCPRPAWSKAVMRKTKCRNGYYDEINVTTSVVNGGLI